MSGRSFLWLFPIVFHLIFPSPVKANPTQALQTLARSQPILKWVFGSQAGGTGDALSKGIATSWAKTRLGTTEVTAERLTGSLAGFEADEIIAQILSARTTHQVFMELEQTAPDALLEAFFQFQSLGNTLRSFDLISPRRLFRQLGGGESGPIGRGLPDGSARFAWNRSGAVPTRELRVRIGEADHAIEPGAIAQSQSKLDLIAFSEGHELSAFGTRFKVAPDGKNVYYNAGGEIRILRPKATGQHDVQGLSLHGETDALLQIREGTEIIAFDVSSAADGAVRIVGIVREATGHYLKGWVRSGQGVTPHGVKWLGADNLALSDQAMVLGTRFSSIETQLERPIVSLDAVDSASFSTRHFVFDSGFAPAGPAHFRP